MFFFDIFDIQYFTTKLAGNDDTTIAHDLRNISRMCYFLSN